MASPTKRELAQMKRDVVLEQVYNLEIDERYLQRAVLKPDCGDSRDKLSKTQATLAERRMMLATLDDIIADEEKRLGKEVAEFIGAKDF